MEELATKLKTAKYDVQMQNTLMKEYMPFIKTQIAKFVDQYNSFDDLLSLGMLVFLNCLKQYDDTKGSFVNYASVSIKNRILDEKKSVNTKVVYMNLEDKHVEEISTAEYSRELERTALAEELVEFSRQLSDFSITLRELTKICPKQHRSRKLCYEASHAIINDAQMRENLIQNKRISQSELAIKLGISNKTIEKYRKYIVTVAFILMGDFPGIKAFLPGYENDQQENTVAFKNKEVVK